MVVLSFSGGASRIIARRVRARQALRSEARSAILEPRTPARPLGLGFGPFGARYAGPVGVRQSEEPLRGTPRGGSFVSLADGLGVEPHPFGATCFQDKPRTSALGTILGGASRIRTYAAREPRPVSNRVPYRSATAPCAAFFAARAALTRSYAAAEHAAQTVIPSAAGAGHLEHFPSIALRSR